MTGPNTVRQKIHQLCISLVNSIRAQEKAISNEPIPSKISLLPLYFMAMQKCAAFRGGCDNKSDNRYYIFQQLRQCSIELMLRFLYPTMFSLSTMNDQVGIIN